MSGDRRSNRDTSGIMSDVDVAATAAASGAKESPKFKQKLDDIWGDENKSSEDLSRAIDAGVEDPIATPTPPPPAPTPAAPAAAPTPAPAVPPANLPESTFRPPADVVPALSNSEPAAPVVPVVEAEEDEPTPAEIASNPKQASAWAQLRAEKKELKQKLLLAEQQIEAAKANSLPAAEAARIAELEKQTAAYEERLGQYDITQTVAFNERYTSPLVARYNRIVTQLSKGSDAATADKIARQLLDPAGDRDGVLAAYPITVQAAVGAALVEIDDLQAQRDSAIQNWRETKAVLGEQESRQNITQLNKSILEDTNKAVEALRLEGNYMYMLSQSDDNWNKGVKDRVTALQGILKTGSREDLVKIVADGLTARHFRENYEKEHLRAEKLAAIINSKVRSAPDLGGSASGAPEVPKKPTKPRPMGTVLDTVWGQDEKF